MNVPRIKCWECKASGKADEMLTYCVACGAAADLNAVLAFVERVRTAVQKQANGQWLDSEQYNAAFHEQVKAEIVTMTKQVREMVGTVE